MTKLYFAYLDFLSYLKVREVPS